MAEAWPMLRAAHCELNPSNIRPEWQEMDL
jgi:hypothetical protein